MHGYKEQALKPKLRNNQLLLTMQSFKNSNMYDMLEFLSSLHSGKIL
jgi:hypothetical protein